MTTDPANVVALPKGTERYVVLYADADAEAAIQAVARWAENPGLAFTWFDAARLTGYIRAAAEYQRRADRKFRRELERKKPR